MNLADFSYDLPPELIAQTPAEPRDSARLFVYNRTLDSIEHRTISDLVQLLPSRTHIVANNSRVRRARHAARVIGTGKEYEIFVLEEAAEPDHYCCMIRGKAPHPGLQFVITKDGTETGLRATVVTSIVHSAMTTFVLAFEADSGTIADLVESTGEIPLPPYITERTASDERYQTTYAGPLGSSAAPTAGLHITPELRVELERHGHTWNEVTLHVGLGTFLPLREDVIEDNELHTEITAIPQTVASSLSAAITANASVLAIGTTSLRTLEGHWQNGQLVAGSQPTNIFLYPGQRIHTANHLLTNFHLPQSSLLVLITAFLAHSSDRNAPLLPTADAIALAQRLYKEAVHEKYRFFSYGDAMLIL